MSAIKSTGLDMAYTFVPGTVIEEVYFAVPVHGTTGDRYDEITEAIEGAIARAEARRAHLSTLSLNAAVSVDVRWVMRRPDGAIIDTAAERCCLGNVEEAREHLARIRKYATA